MSPVDFTTHHQTHYFLMIVHFQATKPSITSNRTALEFWHHDYSVEEIIIDDFFVWWIVATAQEFRCFKSEDVAGFKIRAMIWGALTQATPLLKRCLEIRQKSANHNHCLAKNQSAVRYAK